MGKSNYQDFIKNYDTLRTTLRTFFVYGHYSREDFIEQEISSRKYDNERRRLQVFLPQEYILEKYINHRKYISFYYDYFKCSNYLTETYYTKSYKPIDITLYIRTLQILNANPEGLNLNEILNQMPPDVDLQTIRRKLKRMSEYAYLNLIKDSSEILYKLPDDPFIHLEISQLIQLFHCIEFFSNTMPLSMPGHFLLNTLKFYIKFNRNYNIDFQSSSPFIFKHNHLNIILENEIMYLLSIAIEKHQSVELNYKRETLIIIPLKIISDRYSGKVYTHCTILGQKSERLLRLDKINKITQIKDLPTQISITSENFLGKSWSTSTKFSHHDTISVQALFFINSKTETYLLRRIRKEGKWGSLEQINPSTYLYQIEVNDPNEMIPWFKSFCEKVEVQESDKHDLNSKIKADWRLALEKYKSL
ncbi:WYL domain-containing protein [Fusibacter sp. 3D3]|uniref:WYL domain-containing protein n=1 Tax=Fusibacter sp. 3D3 TaxID=1048380 RepID=UPI000852FD71|nr:WYL domain-containing protein [Fusibacter sp. 3D3]GAU79964.1 hypothetical protein F3D3_4629 [Fusibacter sp. 3D3]